MVLAFSKYVFGTCVRIMCFCPIDGSGGAMPQLAKFKLNCQKFLSSLSKPPQGYVNCEQWRCSPVPHIEMAICNFPLCTHYDYDAQGSCRSVKLQDLKPIMFQPNCKPFCTDYWCVEADIVYAQLWCLKLHMHAHMPDQQLSTFKIMLYLASNILHVGFPLLVQVSLTIMHLYKRIWRTPIIWN